MKYYSTNRKAPMASLEEAVVRGLAPDGGLYMPERIEPLPESLFRSLPDLSLQEISYAVAEHLFGEDIPKDDLKRIVYDTLSFDIPLVKVSERIYSLELFHGPTLAFKDVGARFMARMLSHFIKRRGEGSVNVLVATSGDTGSAVANGFLGVEGVHVYVLYPKGKVSEIQEKQFTTLGKNITAIEVDGVFDDCQAMVKSAFVDKELNEKLTLTSANSINVARFLPQSFYYFYGYAAMLREGLSKDIVVCVPSGNFGNITAGLIAKRMGLPIARFIAANNRNDVFFKYIETGQYTPKPSIPTIANAMDVGAPSNFARILELYGASHEAICRDISASSWSDDEIRGAIKRVYEEHHYLLDPHGACGYLALERGLAASLASNPTKTPMAEERDCHVEPSLSDEGEPLCTRYDRGHSETKGEVGFFLETAHPAKFKDRVETVIGTPIEIPARLKEFMAGEKRSIALPNDFSAFKNLLLSFSQS